MKTKFFFIVLISVLVFSCNKKGCTDYKAVNFSYKAKKDDGSCFYDNVVKIIFWEDSLTFINFLTSDSITSFNYYFNDVLIGSSLTYQPDYNPNKLQDCNDEGVFSYEFHIGESESYTLPWKIKDQNDSLLYQGTFSLSKNNCQFQQLNY